MCSDHVSHERPESREPKARIYVTPDHIKREVVEPTETPDGDHQKRRRLPCRVQEKQESRREQAQKQKQDPFRLDPSRVREIFHSLDISRADRFSPVQLQRELELPRIVGGSRLACICPERIHVGHVEAIGKVEHVDDTVEAEALGEVEATGDAEVVEDIPRFDACIASEIAVERE